MSERVEDTGAGFWDDENPDLALLSYLTLANTVDHGVWQLDVEGRFVAVNDAFVDATGRDREELLGAHASLVLDESAVRRIEREARGRLEADSGNADAAADSETADAAAFDVSIRSADGTALSRELRVVVLATSDGFRGTLGVVPDAPDENPADGDRRDRPAEGEPDDRSAESSEILGRITDGVMAVNEAWEFTHLNERAEEILGVDAVDLRGEVLWEAFPQVVGTTFEDRYREAMATQEPISFEAYYSPSDAWFEEHVYPSETGLSIYFRDISERKETKAELRERERELELFRSLMDHSNDSVLVVDPDTGRYLDVNETACRRRGYSREELLDLTVPDLETELSDREAWDSFVEELKAEGSTTFDGRHRRKDGTTYPVEINATYVELDREYVLATARDVTERKEFERTLTALNESSQELLGSETRTDVSEIVVDTAIDVLDLPCAGCYRYDADREVLVPDAQSASGDFVGQQFPELPVDGGGITARAYRDDELYYYDDETEPTGVRVNASDAEMRSGLFVSMGSHGVLVAAASEADAIDDQRRQLLGILATNARSAYDRVDREQYFRDAKSQLEAATEAGAVGTWEWHIPEDCFVSGPSFARTFGVNPDAAREGVSLDRFVSAIHQTDRDRVEAKIEAAMEACGEYEAEYRVRNADGELRWVFARGHVECDEEGDPVTFPGALADITERKRAEEALAEHKRQLETLFEVLPVGVVVAEADGELVEANDTAEEIWGGDVFDAETIAEYDRYRGWWADSGDPVEPEEWTMARVVDGEEVTNPDVYEIETVDDERRFVMFHGMPIRDECGEVRRGVVTQTDITERKEYQRRLEASNERLEQFAYAASHDLQEPLRMVSSYLRLIEQCYGDDLDEDGLEFLEFAVDGADRMQEMIEGLLEYSRVESRGDPIEPVDLNEVLGDALANLQLQIEEQDGEITADELPRVEGDASQLRQVFQNLLENAVQYSGDAPPRVHVTAERREARSAAEPRSAERSSAGRSSGQYPREYADAAESDGAEWVVSVSDEGIGIDPENADRIFDVFQRLHARDEHDGTGIGLALCNRIVERHGGEMWVDSEPGEGSTFSFTLPADGAGDGDE